ncbi:hypothetical protein [Achromobacter mucicolens]|uniref:hypothetical protein n=1 Tax=Achromobacter mucicolens TaxID=1389922 RepID=UPI00244D6154|nr:hypothetical protein [Achromobacter mucicolens]MDH1522188.1 hypothetical protein [Achromobacter mucicolens]
MYRIFQVLLALLFLAFCAVLVMYWPKTSEQWAGWMQAIGSIAAIGAAIWISSNQHRTSEKREARQRADATRNYLSATRAELSVLWSTYNLRVGDRLTQHNPTELLDLIWPIDHDPFVVYNSNGQMLAGIDDDALRTMLIQTYALGRGLISTWRMHNSLLQDAVRLARYANEFPSEVTQSAARHARGLAVAYGPVLQGIHFELSDLAPRCVQALDDGIKALTPRRTLGA